MCITCALNFSLLCSEPCLTLCTLASNSHSIFVNFSILLGVIAPVPQGAPTVCMFKCSEQLKALQCKQNVRLRSLLVLSVRWLWGATDGGQIVFLHQTGGRLFHSHCLKVAWPERHNIQKHTNGFIERIVKQGAIVKCACTSEANKYCKLLFRTRSQGQTPCGFYVCVCVNELLVPSWRAPSSCFMLPICMLRWDNRWL